MSTVEPAGGGVKGCKFRASKGAKSLAILDVVRCANVRSLATLHAWTTISEHYGVQGVAGSNPAVPIQHIVIKRLTATFGRRHRFG